MTIAEISFIGKAAVFVPYPFSSEDHQAANALALVKRQAALMVRDADVKTKLMDTILELVQDEKLIHQLEANIKNEDNARADETIAREVLKLIKK